MLHYIFHHNNAGTNFASKYKSPSSIHIKVSFLVPFSLSLRTENSVKYAFEPELIPIHVTLTHLSLLNALLNFFNFSILFKLKSVLKLNIEDDTLLSS